MEIEIKEIICIDDKYLKSNVNPQFVEESEGNMKLMKLMAVLVCTLFITAACGGSGSGSGDDTGEAGGTYTYVGDTLTITIASSDFDGDCGPFDLVLLGEEPVGADGGVDIGAHAVCSQQLNFARE